MVDIHASQHAKVKALTAAIVAEDAAALGAMLPLIETISAEAQYTLTGILARRRCVALVQALHGVRWKRRFAEDILSLSAHHGNLVLLAYLAPAADKKSLASALAIAGLGTMPKHLEVVEYLLPHAVSAKANLVRAIEQSLNGVRTRTTQKEENAAAGRRILHALFRHEHVHAVLKSLASANSAALANLQMESLAEFLAEAVHDPAFLAAQSTLKCPRPGAWVGVLPANGRRCMALLEGALMEGAVSLATGQRAATRL